VNQETGVDCAVCNTVMAGYCRSTHSSAPIPEELKTILLNQ